jgi:DNA mismatch repair protein MutS
VIAQARKYLAELESTRDGGARHAPPPAASGQGQLPLVLAPPEPSAVDVRVAAVNPDELTPKAALELVYELKKLADSAT